MTLPLTSVIHSRSNLKPNLLPGLRIFYIRRPGYSLANCAQKKTGEAVSISTDWQSSMSIPYLFLLPT